MALFNRKIQGLVKGMIFKTVQVAELFLSLDRTYQISEIP